MGLSFMIVICFIWVGFVAAISFMESWLKFRAPGVELPVGLSIGRLIFKALNRVEWVCFIILLIGSVISGTIQESALNVSGILVAGILLLQTFVWLPKMDRRASLVIRGEKTEASHLHIYYVGSELIKLVLLVYLGTLLFGLLH